MKRYRLFFLCLFSVACYSQNLSPIGQTVQIYTHFKKIYGEPSWVLILRDVNTGNVIPYQFDFYKKNNFWIALSYAHHYQITSSTLQWGSAGAIHNFCHLENGIISDESLIVTLTGSLSYYPGHFTCSVKSIK